MPGKNSTARSNSLSEGDVLGIGLSLPYDGSDFGSRTPVHAVTIENKHVLAWCFSDN